MRVQRSFTLDTQQRRVPMWVIEVLTEGHPVHDNLFVTTMTRTWRQKFFVPGFGPGTQVTCDARMMAGDWQDGRPPDQMIILPPLKLADLL